MTTSTRTARHRRTWGALLVAATAVAGVGLTGALTPAGATDGARPHQPDAVQTEQDALIAASGFPGAA